jgi:hypothetical protein
MVGIRPELPQLILPVGIIMSFAAIDPDLSAIGIEAVPIKDGGFGIGLILGAADPPVPFLIFLGALDSNLLLERVWADFMVVP